jgi:acetyltransferase-like isoleucine patch superfamily enzyme
MVKISVFKKKITLGKVIGIFRGLLMKFFSHSCGFPITIEHEVRFLSIRTIDIGNWVTIRWHTQIHENVKLGDNVFIGKYCDIGKNVVIEDAVTLADYVCLLGNTHNYNDPENRAGEIYSPGTKVIGQGAWIGYRAIVLPQVRYVGQGSVIGAGAVVTKDVQDHTIVAGNPAKVIGCLFPVPEK